MFIKKDERETKESRRLNIRKGSDGDYLNNWQLAGKHKGLYHGLVCELLLHDKEEFRMFLRIYTEAYEVSKFVLISKCATRLRRGGDPTNPKSGRKICAVILSLKH